MQNELGGLNYIEVVDNGEGISYENIDNTFGTSISQKNTNQKINRIHGSKGKGRFSFSAFAHSAEWDTVYNLDGINYEYKIHINSDNKSSFEIGDKKISEEVKQELK